MKKEKEEEKKVVASHRKARQFYEILETYEAGMSLLGSEVKSLRGGNASLDGCFGRTDDGEIFLHNFYIPPYQFTTMQAPEPRRTRKLLLARKEIDKIAGKLQTKGLTLVPLEVYFRRGWAKVLLGLAKGKKTHDRREDMTKRTIAREAEKSFKGKFRA
jgi:SsrA-binding protein